MYSTRIYMYYYYNYFLIIDIVLDADQPLIEQLYFDIQPVVLLLRYTNKPL